MRTLARCLMVQGTGSDVGKSVIATALCRILRDAGYAVAPFKAQNMSLNAAVTPDGGEIGRAQAAQADAAGVVARVEMNPILLKPEADARSQVVVLGRVTGRIDAREYWSDRNALWPVARAALRTLRCDHEVVVIEGAGSAAELNLRGRDLANMRVAAAADAAVVLVGDIERGGIFAQLLGTLELLRSNERRRVRALLVNKFRGDPALFADGVRILRRRSGLPVFVLPYVEDLGVPAEDSFARWRVANQTGAHAPQIAIVAYPHISNFDDFEPLAAAGAQLRFVRHVEELEGADLIVLPGSKTTVADLAWLRARGIADRIRALAADGTPVLGICGGFQMLGTQLHDPAGVEGQPAIADGLGLLPVRTTFTTRKCTTRVSGRLVAPFVGVEEALAIAGYEIHLGTTDRGDCAPFAELFHGTSGGPWLDGAVRADGQVAGTYVHGLFADVPLRSALLAALGRRRGSAFTPRPLPADPYARLAAWFCDAVDVAALLRSCGVRPRG